MYLEIILGFVVMLFFGLSNSLLKKPSTELSSVYMSFLRNLILSTGLLLLMIFYNPGFNLDINVILYSVFIGFLSYFSLLTFFGALKDLSLSISAPIVNSSIAIILILLAIFTDYNLSIFNILMIIVLILGIYLLSHSKEKSKVSIKGLTFAFLTCILWGSIYYMFAMPSREIGPVFSSFVIEGSVVLFSGLHVLISKKQHFGKVNLSTMKYLVGSSILAVIALTTIKIGVLLPRVDIIYLSTALVPLVASVYGFVVYKEKLSQIQMIGFVTVIITTILLSL